LEANTKDIVPGHSKNGHILWLDSPDERYPGTQLQLVDTALAGALVGVRLQIIQQSEGPLNVVSQLAHCLNHENRYFSR